MASSKGLAAVVDGEVVDDQRQPPACETLRGVEARGEVLGLLEGGVGLVETAGVVQDVAALRAARAAGPCRPGRRRSGRARRCQSPRPRAWSAARGSRRRRSRSRRRATASRRQRRRRSPAPARTRGSRRHRQGLYLLRPTNFLILVKPVQTLTLVSRSTR